MSQQRDTETSLNDGHEKLSWGACVKLDKYELGCSYSVPFFLGEVPEDPKVWLRCDTFADAHHVYIDSWAARPNFIIQGVVNLNFAIARHSGLDSFEPSVVVPYLRKALQWRVVKTDGTPAELKSLQVSVFCMSMSHPPGALFPVHGEPRYFDSITHDRPGGAEVDVGLEMF